jgi:ATP:ADP antiporter, AAA family
VGFLKRIVNVRRSEIPLVLLMFLYFFIVIAIFWILKPIKKDAFVTFYDFDAEKNPLGRTFFDLDGPEAEQIAKVGNMAVAFFAVVVFTLLARKFHRHQLTTIFSAFTVAVLAFFAFTIENSGEVTRWTFYLFGDLFNTLMVATFFVFLNDSVKPDDAKRLYGPIVLGGVAGGAIGSSFLRALIKELSNAQWMWVCIGLTVAVALIALAAGKIVDRNKATENAAKPAEIKPPPSGNAAVEGAKLVLKSRYLLSIVAIVALYEIVSTILDFQFTATVYGLLDDKEAKAQLSTVYAITNWTGLAIQVFATTFIMQRFGIKIALLFMPVAILLNSTAFLILPVLWIGSFLNTTDNALNYSLNQSSREALWTPTSRDEKYKAKAFIDMFVQRFAKAIAVGINLAISALFVGIEGVRWLSLFVVVLIALWLLAARYAGKQFEDMTKDKKS